MELVKFDSDQLSKMTPTQLVEHLEPFNARIVELAAGDRTLKVMAEKVDLEEYVVQVTEIVAAIEKMTADSAAAEAAAAAKADADADDAADEAVVEEPKSEPSDPSVAEPLENRVPVAAALEGVNPVAHSPGFRPQLDETTEPIRPVLVTYAAGLTPVQAGIEGNGGSISRESYNPANYQPTTLAGVGQSIKQLSDQIGKFYLASVDRLGGSVVPRVQAGGTADIVERNTSILRGSVEYPEPVQAILCGRPTELDFGEQCTYRTDTPFWSSINRSVAADACKYRWRKHMTPDEFHDGTSIWNACKQAAIDPCDETTWKPVTNLPDCVDSECDAEPFYVTWGLAFENEDEFCRPEIIAEANQMLEAYKAKRLEEATMWIMDSNSRHLAPVDASSYGLGIGSALSIIVTQALERDTTQGRLQCNNDGSLTAYVYEYFVKQVGLDMNLAGERGGSALDLIRDVFRACGVNNVVVIRDFGCEGTLVSPWDEPGPEMVCNFSCDTVDLAAIDCDPFAFGAGTHALPMLSNQTRIRLVDESKFVKGTTGVTDYAVRRDRQDVRMNRGEYFGEDRMFLFPTMDGDHKILDLTYCISGQRVRHTAELDCALFMGEPDKISLVSGPVESVNDTCEPGGMSTRKEARSKSKKKETAGRLDPAEKVG